MATSQPPACRLHPPSSKVTSGVSPPLRKPLNRPPDPLWTPSRPPPDPLQTPSRPPLEFLKEPRICRRFPESFRGGDPLKCGGVGVGGDAGRGVRGFDDFYPASSALVQSERHVIDNAQWVQQAGETYQLFGRQWGGG
eukprot:219129-Prorocentrum_minimum.AAC.1